MAESDLGKIERGLEHSHVPVFCMPVYAFGSDWLQLQAGTRGQGQPTLARPLNTQRRSQTVPADRSGNSIDPLP
jgi:hypothetical protein